MEIKMTHCGNSIKALTFLFNDTIAIRLKSTVTPAGAQGGGCYKKGTLIKKRWCNSALIKENYHIKLPSKHRGPIRRRQ